MSSVAVRDGRSAEVMDIACDTPILVLETLEVAPSAEFASCEVPPGSTVVSNASSAELNVVAVTVLLRLVTCVPDELGVAPVRPELVKAITLELEVSPVKEGRTCVVVGGASEGGVAGDGRSLRKEQAPVLVVVEASVVGHVLDKVDSVFVGSVLAGDVAVVDCCVSVWSFFVLLSCSLDLVLSF